MTDAPKQYRYKHTFTIKETHEVVVDLECSDDRVFGVTHGMFKRDYEPVEQAAQGWMPIDENTPKDVQLLTWSSNGNIGIESCNKAGEWGIRPLIKRLHRHDDNAEDYQDEPTHFQYLPKPPAREGDVA